MGSEELNLSRVLHLSEDGCVGSGKLFDVDCYLRIFKDRRITKRLLDLISCLRNSVSGDMHRLQERNADVSIIVYAKVRRKIRLIVNLNIQQKSRRQLEGCEVPGHGGHRLLAICARCGPTRYWV